MFVVDNFTGKFKDHFLIAAIDSKFAYRDAVFSVSRRAIDKRLFQIGNVFFQTERYVLCIEIGNFRGQPVAFFGYSTGAT